MELKQQAETVKAALERVETFTIAKQVGEGDAIFGTVTAPEVAEVIQAITNQEVDRRGINLPEIRETGIYRAELKLHPEVTAVVQIQVVPIT